MTGIVSRRLPGMKNKNIEKKFLPEGYRYLKEGEPIKQGDYFLG